MATVDDVTAAESGGKAAARPGPAGGGFPGAELALRALLFAVTLAALHGRVRLLAVGVLCAALTIGMYAAPLGAMVSCSLGLRSLPIAYCPTTRL